MTPPMEFAAAREHIFVTRTPYAYGRTTRGSNRGFGARGHLGLTLVPVRFEVGDRRRRSGTLLRAPFIDIRNVVSNREVNGFTLAPWGRQNRSLGV